MSTTVAPTATAPNPSGTEPEPTTETSPTLARASILNLVGSLVQGVAGFGLVVVVTRRLSTGEAGAFLEAIAIFTLVSRSAMAGADVGLVRFTSRFLARRRGNEVPTLYLVALVPVAVIGAGLGLAMWLAADPVARLVTDGHEQGLVAEHLRVMAPFIPIAAIYQTTEAATRGFATMLPSLVVDRILRAASLPVLVAAAIAAGGGAATIALAWAGPFSGALVLVGLWTVHLLRRAEVALAGALSSSEVPERTPAGVLARRFWGFAWPRSFAGVFALTILWVDTLILGGLAGSDQAAVYVAAVRWLVIGNLAANAVSLAFGPEIARVLVVDGHARARRLFQESAALLILLAIPAYLTAMVFAPFLLTAFGTSYGDGTTVIVITGIGFALGAIAGPVDTLLIMAGRTRQSLVNTGFALVVNIAANLALVPVWGIAGAALAWSLTMVVSNGLPLLQMNRMMGAHPFGADTVRNLGVCAVVGSTLLAARGLLGATPAGLAVGVVAAGGVVAVAALTTPDRLGLQRLLSRADGAGLPSDDEDDAGDR